MFSAFREKQKDTVNRKLLIWSFTCFLILLVWIVIFKASNMESISTIAEKRLHLSFQERLDKMFWFDVIHSSSRWLSLLNIPIFVPFGIYLPLLITKHPYRKTVGIAFSVSLLFEISQFFTALGGLQLEDLLTNTLGAAFGILLYHLLVKKRSPLFINTTNLIICIVFIPVCLFAIVNTAVHYEAYAPFFDGTSWNALWQ